MVQQSSIKAQSWSIVLWMFLGACILTGCGFGRTVPLANGYECYVDDFVLIRHPDTDSSMVDEVAELDMQNEVVFGTREDWRSGDFLGYFIVNTRTHEVQLTSNRSEWTTSIEELEITERNIRWPGVFFHGFGAWEFIKVSLIILIPILLIFFGIRALARHEHELRRQKLERL